MCIFVSSQAIDRYPAAALIAGLQAAGLQVSHSPSNPADKEDPRWENWYETGLAAALGDCTIFVIVIDSGWYSSTWMGIEACEGLEKPGPAGPRQSFYWNPLNLTFMGMRQYLKSELPADLDSSIEVLQKKAHHQDFGPI